MRVLEKICTTVARQLHTCCAQGCRAQEHGARVAMPLLLLPLLVVVLLLAAVVMMVGPGHEELVGLD